MAISLRTGKKRVNLRSEVGMLKGVYACALHIAATVAIEWIKQVSSPFFLPDTIQSRMAKEKKYKLACPARFTLTAVDAHSNSPRFILMNGL